MRSVGLQSMRAIVSALALFPCAANAKVQLAIKADTNVSPTALRDCWQRFGGGRFGDIDFQTRRRRDGADDVATAVELRERRAPTSLERCVMDAYQSARFAHVSGGIGLAGKGASQPHAPPDGDAPIFERVTFAAIERDARSELDSQARLPDPVLDGDRALASLHVVRGEKPAAGLVHPVGEAWLQAQYEGAPLGTERMSVRAGSRWRCDAPAGELRLLFVQSGRGLIKRGWSSIFFDGPAAVIAGLACELSADTAVEVVELRWKRAAKQRLSDEDRHKLMLQMMH